MPALVGLVIFAVTAPNVFGPLAAKVGETTDLQKGTGVERLNKVPLAFADLEHSWEVGLGLNSFPQRHVEPSQAQFGVGSYLPILPLQLLYDTGLVGIIIISLALGLLRPLFSARRARAVGLIVVIRHGRASNQPFLVRFIVDIDRYGHALAPGAGDG